MKTKQTGYVDLDSNLKDILVHAHSLFEQALIKIRPVMSIFPQFNELLSLFHNSILHNGRLLQLVRLLQPLENLPI